MLQTVLRSPDYIQTSPERIKPIECWKAFLFGIIVTGCGLLATDLALNSCLLIAVLIVTAMGLTTYAVAKDQGDTTEIPEVSEMSSRIGKDTLVRSF